MTFIPPRIAMTDGFKMVTLLRSSVSKRSLAVGLPPSCRNATKESLFTPPQPCVELVHKTPSLHDVVEKTIRGWLEDSRGVIPNGNCHSRRGGTYNLCRLWCEQFTGCGEQVHRVGGAA